MKIGSGAGRLMSCWLLYVVDGGGGKEEPRICVGGEREQTPIQLPQSQLLIGCVPGLCNTYFKGKREHHVPILP
jgi:hypothetical protein